MYIRSAILIVSAEKARDILWAMIDVQLSSLYGMDYFINIAGHRFG